MNYSTIIVASSLVLLLAACPLQVKAATVCKVEPSTGFIMCYEDRTISSNNQIYWPRPSYTIDINKPYIPPHNWGDCMISMGCTR